MSDSLPLHAREETKFLFLGRLAIPPFASPFSHSIIHSVIHSLTHSLTHSRNNCAAPASPSSSAQLALARPLQPHLPLSAGSLLACTPRFNDSCSDQFVCKSIYLSCRVMSCPEQRTMDLPCLADLFLGGRASSLLCIDGEGSVGISQVLQTLCSWQNFWLIKPRHQRSHSRHDHHSWQF